MLRVPWEYLSGKKWRLCCASAGQWEHHSYLHENFKSLTEKCPSGYYSPDVQLLFLIPFVHSISFTVNWSRIFYNYGSLNQLEKQSKTSLQKTRTTPIWKESRNPSERLTSKNSSLSPFKYTASNAFSPRQILTI